MLTIERETMFIDCIECRHNPSTFIKGINLCHTHVTRLMQICSEQDGRVIAATASSITRALQADLGG